MNCKQDFPQISIFGASLETNELNPANSLVLKCNSNAFLSVSHFYPFHPNRGSSSNFVSNIQQIVKHINFYSHCNHQKNLWFYKDFRGIKVNQYYLLNISRQIKKFHEISISVTANPSVSSIFTDQKSRKSRMFDVTFVLLKHVYQKFIDISKFSDTSQLVYM